MSVDEKTWRHWLRLLRQDMPDALRYELEEVESDYKTCIAFEFHARLPNDKLVFTRLEHINLDKGHTREGLMTSHGKKYGFPGMGVRYMLNFASLAAEYNLAMRYLPGHEVGGSLWAQCGLTLDYPKTRSLSIKDIRRVELTKLAEHLSEGYRKASQDGDIPDFVHQAVEGLHRSAAQGFVAPADERVLWPIADDNALLPETHCVTRDFKEASSAKPRGPELLKGTHYHGKLDWKDEDVMARLRTMVLIKTQLKPVQS